MCGIVGFTNYDGNMRNEEAGRVLSNMNNTLSKRGPDENGIYIKEDICIAHRRLIVIDPEGGKQPMICKYLGNTYVITYNGQIYNTRELRETLEKSGFTFEGHCDTEVLLKAFIYYGYNVVNHLNGILHLQYGMKERKNYFWQETILE